METQLGKRVCVVLLSFCLTVPTMASAADGSDEVEVSQAVLDADGFLAHTVRCPQQADEVLVRVLLPETLEADKRYPVLYVLPVEAQRGTRYGDGLAEVRKHNLHHKHGLICVAPDFAHLPWYADHPSDPALAQERYFLGVVLPLVEKNYPALARPEGRLLLGFSKSGWGAWSLLLRHSERFARAAAWDAPLMMDSPGRYGSGPIFDTEENFQKYQISRLLKQQAGQLGEGTRLGLFGYGGFRTQHVQAHELMQKLGIAHAYEDGPERKHTWHSGWAPQAVEFLVKPTEE